MTTTADTARDPTVVTLLKTCESVITNVFHSVKLIDWVRKLSLKINRPEAGCKVGSDVQLQFRRKEAGRLAVGAAWGRGRHQRAGRPAVGSGFWPTLGGGLYLPGSASFPCVPGA
jgi:hypothetical protein